MQDSVEIVSIKESWKLDEYSDADASLTLSVNELVSEAAVLTPALKGRKIWMVNSTAAGGGVAEMMPKMVSLMRDLGLDVEWVVLKTEREDFFRFTKKLHNLIHDSGDPNVSEEERRVYEDVNRNCARAMSALVSPGDLLVIHDPQPMGMGMYVKEQVGLPLVWRCHIGLDRHTAATRAAWGFLKNYSDAYDTAVFTAPEYMPDYFAARVSIIRPAIDPLSHKNRRLSPHKLVGVLVNSRLSYPHHPVLTPDFEYPARRLQPDLGFGDPHEPDHIGLLFRPTVTQISRWDRLKGFRPLLDAFGQLKERRHDKALDARTRRRLEIVRLVFGGPDPASIQDDPEGLEVLEEIKEAYAHLPDPVQRDVAILALPMASRKENALMVNALQCCSTVVVQNSLQEGFGLTVTEAMWKGVPILASSACGIRQQIRDGVDGRLIKNAEDVDELASALFEVLQTPWRRSKWANSAERRVRREFLVFSQVAAWLRVLVAASDGQKP